MVYSDIYLGLKIIRERRWHFIDSFSWAERTLACWAASFCLCDLPGFLFSYEIPVDTMDIITKPAIARCEGGSCTFHVNHSVIGLSVCSWSSSWLNSSIKEMLIGNWVVEINMSNELVLQDICVSGLENTISSNRDSKSLPDNDLLLCNIHQGEYCKEWCSYIKFILKLSHKQKLFLCFHLRFFRQIYFYFSIYSFSILKY